MIDCRNGLSDGVAAEKDCEAVTNKPANTNRTLTYISIPQVETELHIFGKLGLMNVTSAP